MNQFTRVFCGIGLIMCALLGTSGCGTSTCTVVVHPATVIRWGEMTRSSGDAIGYQINAEHEMFDISASNGRMPEPKGKLGNVDAEKFCSKWTDIRKLFLREQAVSTPGDESRFIEYRNDSEGVVLRAIWNKAHQTFGSKEFRAMYDSLQAFVPALN